MRVDRLFIGIGVLYAIFGVWLGGHMGRTGDHSQMPTHAHIMMLGFVAMVLFGITYKVWPQMQKSRLSSAHFCLHQFGTPIMLIATSMELGGRLPQSLAPVVFPVSEISIFAGFILFGWNFWKVTGGKNV